MRRPWGPCPYPVQRRPPRHTADIPPTATKNAATEKPFAQKFSPRIGPPDSRPPGKVGGVLAQGDSAQPWRWSKHGGRQQATWVASKVSRDGDAGHLPATKLRRQARRTVAKPQNAFCEKPTWTANPTRRRSPKFSPRGTRHTSVVVCCRVLWYDVHDSKRRGTRWKAHWRRRTRA